MLQLGTLFLQLQKKLGYLRPETQENTNLSDKLQETKTNNLVNLL